MSTGYWTGYAEWLSSPCLDLFVFRVTKMPREGLNPE